MACWQPRRHERCRPRCLAALQRGLVGRAFRRVRRCRQCHPFVFTWCCFAESRCCEVEIVEGVL